MGNFTLEPKGYTDENSSPHTKPILYVLGSLYWLLIENNVRVFFMF